VSVSVSNDDLKKTAKDVSLEEKKKKEKKHKFFVNSKLLFDNKLSDTLPNTRLTYFIEYFTCIVLRSCFSVGGIFQPRIMFFVHVSVHFSTFTRTYVSFGTKRLTQLQSWEF